MEISDPLVGSIFRALGESSATFDEKVNAVIRAGKIAEAYCEPNSRFVSALKCLVSGTTSSQ